MVSCNLVKRGMQWCSWLRHCAESRKVARSIPDGVTGIFRWHNPSGRTMALGLTQPLTEMSTRNISWGKKRPVSRTDKLTTFMCRLCWNLGASTSWNPQGLSRPVMGLFHLFYLYSLQTGFKMSSPFGQCKTMPLVSIFQLPFYPALYIVSLLSCPSISQLSQDVPADTQCGDKRNRPL